MLPLRFSDRFILTDLIEQGGMGAVFRAVEERPGSSARQTAERAIKVLPRRADSKHAQYYEEAFRREAGASTLLAPCSSFVEILGFGIDPPHLVMELITWPTLAAMRGHSTFSSLRAAQLGASLLEALGHLHGFNLVHCDLKPSNLFITRGQQPGQPYRVKIADLGAAVHASTKPLDRLVGTISYLSPEQLFFQPIGFPSDLHAVGSIIWELVTDTIPFPVTGEGDKEQIEARRQRVKELPDRPMGMSEGLFIILHKALAFDPAARYPNAEEMRQALLQYVAETHAAEAASRERIQCESRELAARLESLLAMLNRVAALKEEAEKQWWHIRQILRDEPERSVLVIKGEVDAIETQIKDLSQQVRGYFAPSPPPPLPVQHSHFGYSVLAFCMILLFCLGLAAVIFSTPSHEPNRPSGISDCGDAGQRPEAAEPGPEAREKEDPIILEPVTITIATDPPGALVLMNGEEVCLETPCQIHLSGDQLIELRLEKKYFDSITIIPMNLDEYRSFLKKISVSMELSEIE